MKSIDPPPTPMTAGKDGWPWVFNVPTELESTMSSKKQWPRISIVTPSYNQGDYLEQTIRSVLLQYYPNMEYFVIDGGSDDHSQAIIQYYAESLDYSVSEPDHGQVDAIKKGFSRATGDILCWLNSDDLLEPYAMIRVAEAWCLHGGDVIVTGGCREVFGQGPYNTHYPNFQQAFNQPQALPLKHIFDLRHHWLEGDFFYQPEVFFPKAAFIAVGGLDDSLHFAMDYDLWIRMAIKDTPIVVIRHPLACFRFHGAQKTSDRQAVLEETVDVADRYLAGSITGLIKWQRSALIKSNRMLLKRWSSLFKKLVQFIKRQF